MRAAGFGGLTTLGKSSWKYHLSQMSTDINFLFSSPGIVLGGFCNRVVSDEVFVPAKGYGASYRRRHGNQNLTKATGRLIAGNGRAYVRTSRILKPGEEVLICYGPGHVVPVPADKAKGGRPSGKAADEQGSVE